MAFMSTSSPTSFVVLGAGAMGRAVVYELARDRRARVLVLDGDVEAARAVATRYGRGRARAAHADARELPALAQALRGSAVVVNCAPYRLNLGVMEAALRAGVDYVDLGGLFHTTRKQLGLDREFRAAGRLAVLGMGSAPGIANLLAVVAAEGMRRVRSVMVYNGGADFTAYPAGLAFGFSPVTILDEIMEPAMVFTKGRFEAAAPLSRGERFRFGLGAQEVHAVLHSEVATLPRFFRDRGIRECAFLLAHDPVLLDRLRLLIGLGLADPRPGPRGVAPRDVLLDAFRRLPKPPAFIDDRDELAVVVEGEDASGPLSARASMLAFPQRRPPLSAVACDTGFPPAIVARMIAAGGIGARGVKAPEDCVPARPFLAALSALGLAARLTRTRLTPAAARTGRGTSRASRR
jgi:saccharopine dehydrogenase-like NADP-dependent oxidoreductase